jgi:hypothetical protein
LARFRGNAIDVRRGEGRDPNRSFGFLDSIFAS